MISLFLTTILLFTLVASVCGDAARRDAMIPPSGQATPNPLCDEPAGVPQVCQDLANLKKRWYYTKGDGVCRLFPFDGTIGCGVTGNGFDSKEECQSTCALHQDVCTLPSASGRGIDGYTFYYFDTKTRQCKQFTFLGSFGNSNRFGTWEACQARCM